jgi:carbon-monoxide dehydrogenase medium subunit
MILPRFEYRAARSVEEALALWAEEPGSRYFAGGTDLLPQMRLRLRVPRLIDVKRIPELGLIREGADGSVSIGATALLSAIAEHPAIRGRYPALRECCLVVGSFLLRNRATMIGNICNASPAADTALALMALEAEVVAAGPRGRRRIPISLFFQGPGKTALEAGELVTEVILPAATMDFRASYQRLSRRRGMDLATVGVLVACGANGTRAHRVVLGAVAPTPLRVSEAEALLDREGPEGASRAALVARDAARPITDIRGSADYRREMVAVLVRRGVWALSSHQ